MAIYEVKSTNGDTQLIECRLPKTAIVHVATKCYTVRTLKMSEALKRVVAGEQIESIEEARAVSEEE